MAARRLLIVMVILLITSTVVAVLAPRPADDGEEENGTATERAQELDEPGWRPSDEGESEIRRVEVRVSTHTEVIETTVGDHIDLQVWDQRRRVIAIPQLGRIDTVGRAAPARFDLLLDRPGQYEVVALDPDRVIATILTRP